MEKANKKLKAIDILELSDNLIIWYCLHVQGKTIRKLGTRVVQKFISKTGKKPGCVSSCNRGAIYLL